MRDRRGPKKGPGLRKPMGARAILWCRSPPREGACAGGRRRDARRWLGAVRTKAGSQMRAGRDKSTQADVILSLMAKYIPPPSRVSD